MRNAVGGEQMSLEGNCWALFILRLNWQLRNIFENRVPKEIMVHFDE